MTAEEYLTAQIDLLDRVDEKEWEVLVRALNSAFELFPETGDSKDEHEVLKRVALHMVQTFGEELRKG